MARKPRKQPATQFNREVNEFLFDRKARNLTPKTLQWYAHALKLWREYHAAEGIESTTQLQPIHLRRFLVHLAQAGHNEGGVYNIFGAVRAYLRWYAAEYAPAGWKNPLNKIETPKRAHVLEQPLSLEHFQKLVDACKPGQQTHTRDRAILLFLLDSGVRHQELADLAVGDVSLKNGAVFIRRGKGRKSRTVFVGQRTRRALTRYMRLRPSAQDDEPLWLTRDGKRLTKSGIRQVIARRAKQAGIPEPGLHEFRRAFAVNFLRNGGDVVTLQRLLGHANLSMVTRYLALVDDDLRASHDRFGVVDNL